MSTSPPTLRFSHHAISVLSAAVLTSTIFAAIWMAAVVFSVAERFPGGVWLATMTLLCWLGVFIVVLPGAGLVFSVLWPLTRRGSRAASLICLLAAIALGTLLAPLASPNLRGVSLSQLFVFALTGAATATIYLSRINRVECEKHRMAHE